MTTTPEPAVPPRVLLAHVLGAIATELPARHPTLLGADRFAGERTVLARLAQPEHTATVTSTMDEDEAGTLTALLLRRWAALGAPDVPPLAVIVGTGPYAVATHGVEPGWTAQWSGPVRPAADGRTAEPDPDAPAGTVTVRVFARTTAGRTVLADSRAPEHIEGSGAS